MATTTPTISPAGEVAIPIEGTTGSEADLARQLPQSQVPFEGHVAGPTSPSEWSGAAAAAPATAPQAGGPVEQEQLQRPLQQQQQQPPLQAGEVDAVMLLTSDHTAVMTLYEQYLQTRDLDAKHRVAHEIIRDVCIHASIEERVLYPAMRDRLQPDGKLLADRALQEHLQLERRLSQLDNIKLRDNEPEYSSVLAQAMSEFKAHALEEETVLFVTMRAQWDQQFLLNLGRKLRKARRTAPTRPHPRLPKEGMMAKMGGAVAGVYDRVADRISKTV